jgi:hypothetical protein
VKESPRRRSPTLVKQPLGRPDLVPGFFIIKYFVAPKRVVTGGGPKVGGGR